MSNSMTVLSFILTKTRSLISTPVGIAVSFWLFANSLDMLTSYFAPSWVFETNVFARNIAHHFDLTKGLEIKAWFLLADGIIAGVFYNVIKHYDRKLAEVVAAAPFLLQGVDVVLNATLANFFFIRGFYVG